MAFGKGKFFGGRKATTQLVDLSIEDGHLIIVNAGGERLGRWPIERIFRDDTHMVAMIIGCGGDDERLELLDETLIRELKLKSSVWKMEHLKKERNSIAMWIVVSVGVIALALWYSDSFTRLLVSSISLDRERQLGDMIASRADLKVCKLKEKQRAAVDAVLKRLFKNDPENLAHIRVDFIKGNVVNAFTFPGGSIYFYTGLLADIESPEEFAGILAHEVEHVEKRHITQSVAKALLLTGMFNFVFGDFSAIVLIDPQTAANLLSLKMSRGMEAEADAGALKRLKDGEISPRGMVDFFARLSRLDIAGGKLGFLSTHPFSEDRARFFERAIPKDDNPFESFLPKDQWDEIRSVCKD